MTSCRPCCLRVGSQALGYCAAGRRQCPLPPKDRRLDVNPGVKLQSRNLLPHLDKHRANLLCSACPACLNSFNSPTRVGLAQRKLCLSIYDTLSPLFDLCPSEAPTIQVTGTGPPGWAISSLILGCQALTRHDTTRHTMFEHHDMTAANQDAQIGMFCVSATRLGGSQAVLHRQITQTRHLTQKVPDISHCGCSW
jgi:hypothetical protein